jgi:hypothetical protein
MHSDPFSPSLPFCAAQDYYQAMLPSMTNAFTRSPSATPSQSGGVASVAEDKLVPGTAVSSDVRDSRSSTSTNRPADAPTLGAAIDQDPATVESTEARVQNLKVAAEVRELSKRDQAVRTHERAHASVAGAHGGSPQFQYQRGPDGVLYAVAGSVSVDLSPVADNPQATLAKAQTIRRAALAPADPSAADRAVAAQASAMAADATVAIRELSALEAAEARVEAGAGQSRPGAEARFGSTDGDSVGENDSANDTGIGIGIGTGTGTSTGTAVRSAAISDRDVLQP